MIDTDERALLAVIHAIDELNEHSADTTELRQARDYLQRRLGEGPLPESVAEFALRSLVAVGHVSQETVDKALAIAAQFRAHDRATPPAPDAEDRA